MIRECEDGVNDGTVRKCGQANDDVWRRTTSPRPRVVAITLGDVGHVASERVVDLERRGARVGEIAHGAEERVAHLGHDGCAPQRVTQRGGRRRRRHGLAQKTGDRRLVVVHEDRTMLQQRAALPPLRRADELSPVQGHFAPRRLGEAGRGRRRRRSRRGGGERHGHSERFEGEAEQGVDATIFRDEGPGVVAGRGHAVGDLPVVQERAPPGGAPDDADAALSEQRVAVHTDRPLVAAKRKRRLRPRIDAEHGLAGSPGARHERFVERHVFRPTERWGEQQTPGQPFGGYNEGSRGTSRLGER